MLIPDFEIFYLEPTNNQVGQNDTLSIPANPLANSQTAEALLDVIFLDFL